MEGPSQFSKGQTAQGLTCSIMEKPLTGLVDCLRMLQACFRKEDVCSRSGGQSFLSVFPPQLKSSSLLCLQSLPKNSFVGSVISQSKYCTPVYFNRAAKKYAGRFGTSEKPFCPTLYLVPSLVGLRDALKTRRNLSWDNFWQRPTGYKYVHMCPNFFLKGS